MIVMSSLSKTQWILAALLVLAVAFVGSMAGSWFAGWRQDKAHREKLEGLYSRSPASGSVDDTFPRVELLDIDGNNVELDSLIEGHQTLVFFLAPTCDMCTDLVDAYKRESGGFPVDLKAFAVCPDLPGEARTYAGEHDIPFPLYCDTAQSFQSKHGVVAFPTLMALDKHGVIRYVNFGMMEGYDFEDILDKLKQY